MQALQDLYEMATEYWESQPEVKIKSLEQLINELAASMTDLMREMKTEAGFLSSTGAQPMAMTLQARSPPVVVMELTNGKIEFVATPGQRVKLVHTRPNGQSLSCDGTRVTVTGAHRRWQFQRVGVHGYLTYRFEAGREVRTLPVDSRTLPDSFIRDIALAINHVLDAQDALVTMLEASDAS